MKHIVKRKGHIEPFDGRKLYASVYASCTALRMADKEAELIAKTVESEVTDALKDSSDVTAHTIHKKVVENLRKYHPDAAYLYENHKDIS